MNSPASNMTIPNNSLSAQLQHIGLRALPAGLDDFLARATKARWSPRQILEQIVGGGILVGTGVRGVLRAGAEAQALAVLDQEPEQAVAALADDLDRARARRVARRVEQPVTPREIEELLARLLQYAVDVAHRTRALPARIDLDPGGPKSTPGIISCAGYTAAVEKAQQWLRKPPQLS